MAWLYNCKASSYFCSMSASVAFLNRSKVFYWGMGRWEGREEVGVVPCSAETLVAIHVACVAIATLVCIEILSVVWLVRLVSQLLAEQEITVSCL